MFSVSVRTDTAMQARVISAIAEVVARDGSAMFDPVALGIVLRAIHAGLLMPAVSVADRQDPEWVGVRDAAAQIVYEIECIVGGK